MIEKVLYIEKLISEGESLHLDFKFAVNDSRKIARSLVAFANTDGGKLLIGVKDNGVIAGIKTEEEFFMVQSAATIFSYPEVKFKSKEWNLKGKRVLEVSIEKSTDIPHFVIEEDNKKIAYIRILDENIKANGVILKTWKKQNSEIGVTIKLYEKEKFVLDYLKTNPQTDIKQIGSSLNIKRFTLENILAKFLIVNVVEISFNGINFVYQLKDI